VRHLDDGGQNRAAARIGFKVLQELQVDLQDIQRDVLERVKGGIAGAEVVHQHQEAVLPQLAHGIHQLFRIVVVGGFRDFQTDQGMVHAVGVRHPVQFIRQVRIVQRLAGGVDGDADRFQSAFGALLQIDADIFPHVAVDPGDESGLLKQRDEQAGAEPSLLGMVPAHQRFRAGHRAQARLDHRLVPDLELMVLQGLFHVVADLLLLHELAG